MLCTTFTLLIQLFSKAMKLRSVLSNYLNTQNLPFHLHPPSSVHPVRHPGVQ